ncbi:carbohydrate-binding protein [Bacillus sp. SCS-151]|uniref:carbohydrate-binding protein n=1 Tax=Nanhaiella sioensis TaxID=3115293 RepID=UPI00397D8A18
MFKRNSKTLRSIAVFFLIVCLTFTSFIGIDKGIAAGESVQVWLTTPDETKLLEQQEDITFSRDSSSANIHIDENIEYQEMDGFGAAVSGSSAYLLNQLNESDKEQILNDLFSEKGIDLSFVRQTIGASDFNLKSYTYDDMPEGEIDPTLSHFTIDEDRIDVIPVLQQIKSINPQLKILGTPWSAPAWMKESGTLNGGSLDPQHFQSYADYFVKYLQAYESEGLPIYAVTVQNEPHHETTSYPSMYMDANQQIDFVKNYLGPTFNAEGMDTKIIAWDHNWNEFDYPIQVLNDEEANSYVAGSAFHCYAGAPESQSAVFDAHPDKGIWFTECSGGEWATDFGDNLKWNMSNIVIGATRNWAKSVLLWNLALDENFGPINGGCVDCRGVVTVNQGTGDIVKNVEYYVLGHISKFVKPGAKRIESNENTEIENVVFKNRDGSKVLLAMNSTNEQKTFKVRWGTQAFEYSLPAGAVATFTWNGEQEGDSGLFELNPYQQMEAENFSSMEGVATESANDIGGGLVVGQIDNDDYVVFKNVNFDDGAQLVKARVATEADGGQIEFRLGSPTGTLISTIDIPNTGGWQSWITSSAQVENAIGVHDLYIVFKGGSNGIGNFNWFEFSATNEITNEVNAFERIEAENYDTLFGIQTEGANDAGYGLNVGHTDDGDYIGFKNVNFGSGAISVEARVATDGDGGELEFRLDSPTGPVISTIDVEKTGGWQSWVTRSAKVLGADGVHDLYVVFKSETGGIGNLNWFTFSDAIQDNPAINAFEQIEAENYDTQYGVQTENSSDVGGGLNVGHTDNGDYIGYNNVDFGEGAVAVEARVATDSEGGMIELHLDSPTGDLIGTINITKTGGWQSWVTESAEISGAKGVHDVYLVFKSEAGGIGNVNWLKFINSAQQLQQHIEAFKSDSNQMEQLSAMIVNSVMLGEVDGEEVKILLQEAFLAEETANETVIHVRNITEHIERDLERMAGELDKKNFDSEKYISKIAKELEKLINKTS